MDKPTGLIGVIGGSGIYQMEGLSDIEEVKVETPFGPPSDAILLGTLSGRRLAFLPRHGRGHRLLPREVNSHANMYAFKSIGVDWVLSLSAVGSLREEILPRDVVIPDQVYDGTKGRNSTYFGDGVVAHVSFAEPFCPVLRTALIETCRELKLNVHDRGVYYCMEGPAFSSKAESAFNRAQGFSVVGMTSLPEAKLAREAELAYACVALSTDYDVWHESGEVSVELVIENLHANVRNVQKVLKSVVAKIPLERTSPAHDALRGAIMTDPKVWPSATVEKLGLIIDRYLVRR